jgi:hypothetical protein
MTGLFRRCAARVTLETLAIVYTLGLIAAAFDARGRQTWRAVWLARRPDVVKLVDRRTR